MAQNNATTKQKVLDLLKSSRSEYVNGQDIAQTLSISRTAVWKAINSLRKDGITIDAVSNKGYRLGSESGILSAQSIKEKLNDDVEVLFYSSVDSTNTQAKRLLEQGKENTFLIVADEQTQGRGRQGKTFYSPKSTGVYMSLVLHPDAAFHNAVSITTAAAVCVCKTIEKLSDKKPEIKWVNDIYVNNKKVCGILAEAISDAKTQRVSSVILGIGINLTTSKFPSELKNIGSLSANVDRAELIAQIVYELFDLLRQDNKNYIDYYREHSMVIGKRINIFQNERITPALAVEIDGDGGLVVETFDGERQTLRSGEITLRIKED